MDDQRNPNAKLFEKLNLSIMKEFDKFDDAKLLPVFSVILSYFVGVAKQDVKHEI